MPPAALLAQHVFIGFFVEAHKDLLALANQWRAKVPGGTKECVDHFVCWLAASKLCDLLALRNRDAGGVGDQVFGFGFA